MGKETDKTSKKRGRRIPLAENPLYPAKKESSLKGTIIAITIVVAIIVLDVILTNAFSPSMPGI